MFKCTLVFVCSVAYDLNCECVGSEKILVFSNISYESLHVALVLVMWRTALERSTVWYG